MLRNTRRMTCLTAALAVAALAPCLLTSAVAQVAPAPPDSDHFVPTAAVTLSNTHLVTAKPLNSFDISFVDPTIGLYVLADRTNNAVDLVDTVNNTFLAFCGHGQFQGVVRNAAGAVDNNLSGPDGVLIRDHREIWVGDGNSTVKVFDVAGCDATTKPKDVIPTGVAADKRADEM